MVKWLEVLKSGKVTDSLGRDHNFSNPDLDKIADNYNNQRENDAPLVKGHPVHDKPAQGWVEKLKRIGNILMAKPKKVLAEFAGEVKKGMFKYISVSLRPNKTLKHIGFFGAAPVAVTGLKPASFNEGEEDLITFNFSSDELNFIADDWSRGRIPSIGRIFQKLREFIIDKYDKKTADDVISSWDTEYLKEEPPREEIKEVVDPTFNEVNHVKEVDINMDELEKLQKKVEDLTTKVQSFTESEETLKKENTDFKTQIDSNEKDREKRIKKEVSDFVEGVKKKNMLLPKFEMGIKNVLTRLKLNGENVNFSETEEKPEYEILTEFMECDERVPEGTLKVEVDLKDVGVKEFGENVDEERLEMYKKAVALAEKKGIDFAEAVAKIEGGV